MEEIVFPKISDERKKDIQMSVAYSRLQQDNLNFDLQNFYSNEALNAFREERERRIEYTLRYLIPHPIKGEITKSKCRYRGLYIKEYDSKFNPTTLEEKNGVCTLHCYFMLPSICGLPSRSGKRKPFEISLAFQNDTLLRYQLWCQKNEMMMFGIGKENGIREQIRS